MKLFYVHILIVLFTLSGINLYANEVDSLKTDSLLDAYATLLIDEMITESCNQKGSSYKYGGRNTDGFDCSGLLNYAASKIDITLPRSSRDIARLGHSVATNELQPGDFLFFKGRNIKSNTVGHVALVTQHLPNQTSVVHATTHGVKMEIIQHNTYFMPRWLYAKRIIPGIVKREFLN